MAPCACAQSSIIGILRSNNLETFTHCPYKCTGITQSTFFTDSTNIKPVSLSTSIKTGICPELTTAIAVAAYDIAGTAIFELGLSSNDFIAI